MFSNYESLNTDEKKSAVSHFISEMQMADDTLPLPITKPSFSERVNMELQNYYATKNNPDTNDTVEDSIDTFFGNIPLYNYLNAIFAPTERERKRNLIRGIESSLRAIENLPYTSSMMGDISIVHPYPAVAPEPYDSRINGWYNPDGSINYPPNNGAVAGTEKTVTLQPGKKLGRFGEVRPESNYVTDAGVHPDKAALPPHTSPSEYRVYEIVKPIPNTIKSTVAEWPIGSGTGGATQYELPMPILDLLDEGYLKIKIK